MKDQENLLTFEVGERLLQLLPQIEVAVEALGLHLKSLPLRSAVCCAIPRVMREEELAEENLIPVTVSRGETALERASAAFGQFHAQEGESGRSTFRLPGILAFDDPHPHQTLSIVTEINRLKSDFKSALRQLPTKEARFEAVHKAFPYLITLQATRAIHAFSEPMKSARLVWTHRPSVLKKSKADVIEMLERARRRPRATEESITWDQVIDNYQREVASLPDHVELRQHRKGKVQPAVNLRGLDGPLPQKPGHLPLIILNPAEGFRCEALRDYDPAAVGKTWSRGKRRVIKDEPLIPSMNIFETDTSRPPD